MATSFIPNRKHTNVGNAKPEGIAQGAEGRFREVDYIASLRPTIYTGAKQGWMYGSNESPYLNPITTIVNNGQRKEGEKYLLLPGLVNNYATTPHAAAVNTLNDFVLQVTNKGPLRITSCLISKNHTSNNTYTFGINGSGFMYLSVSTSGTSDTSTATSDTAFSTASEGFRVIRVGAVAKFFQLLSGTWTQLGADRPLPATTLASRTAPIKIGAFGNTGAGQPMRGNLRTATIWNNADPLTAPVFHVDFNKFQLGAASGTADTGQVVTIVGTSKNKAKITTINNFNTFSSAWYPTSIRHDGRNFLHLPGVIDNYAKINHEEAFNLGENFTLEFRGGIPVAGDCALITHWNVDGWRFSQQTDTLLHFDFGSGYAQSDIGTTITEGARVVRYGETVEFWVLQSGVWNMLGNPVGFVTGPAPLSNEPLRIGQGDNFWPLRGRCEGISIWDNIDPDNTTPFLKVDFNTFKHGANVGWALTGHKVQIMQSGNEPAFLVGRSMMYWDGINDFLSLEQSLFADNNPRTLIVVYQQTNIAQSTIIAGQTGPAGGNDWFAFALRTDNPRESDPTVAVYSGLDIYSDQQSHTRKVAIVTHDGYNMNLWRNGLLVGYQTGAILNTRGTQNFEVGRVDNGAGGDGFYMGYIEDIIAFDYALSEAQVKKVSKILGIPVETIADLNPELAVTADVTLNSFGVSAPFSDRVAQMFNYGHGENLSHNIANKQPWSLPYQDRGYLNFPFVSGNYARSYIEHLTPTNTWIVEFNGTFWSTGSHKALMIVGGFASAIDGAGNVWFSVPGANGTLGVAPVGDAKFRIQCDGVNITCYVWNGTSWILNGAPWAYSTPLDFNGITTIGSYPDGVIWPQFGRMFRIRIWKSYNDIIPPLFDCDFSQFADCAKFGVARTGQSVSIHQSGELTGGIIGSSRVSFDGIDDDIFNTDYHIGSSTIYIVMNIPGYNSGSIWHSSGPYSWGPINGAIIGSNLLHTVNNFGSIFSSINELNVVPLNEPFLLSCRIKDTGGLSRHAETFINGILRGVGDIPSIIAGTPYHIAGGNTTDHAPNRLKSFYQFNKYHTDEEMRKMHNLIGNPLLKMAYDDSQAHFKALESQGKTLSEEAKSDTINFASQLYTIVGQRVDFWNLRSDYNMGSGGVAYSLQGQIGTLINSPTWGVDGISTSGPFEPYNYIKLPDILPTGNPDFHVLSVHKGETTSVDWATPWSAMNPNEPTAATGISVPYHPTTGTDNGAVTWNGEIHVARKLNNRFWAALGHSNMTTYYSENGGVMLTDTTTDVLNYPSINQAVGIGKTIFTSDRYFMGSHSFWGIVPRVLTEAENAAIYAAYKQTIGKGLGLP